MKGSTQTLIRLIRPTMVAGVLAFSALELIPPALSVPGELLGTVQLPGNNGGDDSSVGGAIVPTTSGVAYVATQGQFATNLLIYVPPENGNGVATLLATKTLVDGAGEIKVSCIAWDPTRQVLWGSLSDGNGPVFQIDVGDITVSGNTRAKFQFNSKLFHATKLCDGMAYDQERDTLWISPDLDLSVFEFGLGDKDPLGALLSTVSPENGQGDRDGKVSGVVVGKGDTLYVGRGFDSEIRKVDKNTGTFVSDFTRTSSADGGHVEDLTCDPLTYAPREAILAKHNTGEFYEAFEVEEGTCPLRPRTFGGEASPLLACFFECKPRSPLTWQGITTLVLVSLERSTPANTNVSVVIRGGISGQGAIAALRFPSTSVINSFTVESHDVDEISICGSLEEAGVRVPEIGLVEIIQRNPVTFGTPPRRIYGWVKNLLGTFRMDVNEPFSRRNIARGIAKTECRVVPTTLEELEDRVDAADLVQPISPIFIEETLDLPPLGSP